MRKTTLYYLKIPTNKKGLTLLEVLIALVLFTFISISLIRMTNKTTQYREKITRNIQDTKYSRNILQMIRKDIRNTFYTKDMNALAHNTFLKKENQKEANPDAEERSQTTSRSRQRRSEQQEEKQAKLDAFNREVEPYLYRKVIFSGGIAGKTNSLHIVSLSNIYTGENSKNSDQNIIIYYLKPCKNREDKKEETSSSCLWRKFSPVTQQNLINLKDYDEFVLLEKVNKFQISYYNESSNEWLKEWNTTSYVRGSILPRLSYTKTFLPSAIHIELEFENKKKQSVKQEIQIPLHQQFILPLEKNI